jgi:two-component system, OmpR family, response regulator
MTGSAVATSKVRVLVVDDNRDAADSLCRWLRARGYDVRTAYDGQSALDEAMTFEPACVFLDLGLPVLDGFDVARQIRQHPVLNAAKLVALTAYSHEEHGKRVRSTGFDHHLVKPASPADIERILEMLNQVVKLASRTEQLAQRNIKLARETKNLLGETQKDIQDVKQEIKEVKEEIREVKEELRDMKSSDNGQAGTNGQA